MSTTMQFPVIITPRLLPGVRIGSAFISIEYSPLPRDGSRERYRYHLDLPNGEYSADDLQSGCQGGNLQEGLSSLLSFLSHAAECYDFALRRPELAATSDGSGFPEFVELWAYENEYEIDSLQIELDETPHLIEEG